MRLWNLRGAFSAVHSSITSGAYATGYALHLGASTATIGLLSAAPSWGGILQVFSPLLIERLPSRKMLCLVAFGISFIMWLPVAVLPFLVPEGAAPWMMVALITVSGLASASAAPANSSWLTDMVPGDIRGRFVARQQSIIAGVGLAVSLGAGAYLDLFSPDSQQTGFTSLFIIAVAFGMAAITVWNKIPEPPKPAPTRESVTAFLSLPFRHKPFRTFMLLVSMRGMFAMVAAPFFAVYMLQNLGIPYSEIALFASLQTLLNIGMNPLWGYLGDKYGYRPVLIICSAGLALYPLWWVFATPENYWIVVPLTQAWGGMMSAGIPTARFNLMAKIAPEENRSVYIGCYSALFNIGNAVGAMMGGALAVACAGLTPLTLFGYTIADLQYLFIGGCILRLFGLGMLRHIREEASTSPRDLIEQVGRGHPLSTIWHLVRMGRSSDPVVKARAARELGETGNALAVEELISLLNDSDRRVRREAVRALGNIGDERAVSPLLDIIADPSSDITEEAIEALGAIRTPLSLNILVTLLNDGRPDIRKSAVLALGRFSDRRTMAGLMGLLEQEQDRTIVVAATETLSKMGDTRIMPRLQELMRDCQSEIERKTVAQSVSHLLGMPDRFYRLLQADPMTRDRLVSRIFASARRLLVRWTLNQTLDAPYYETQLDDGLQRYDRQAYDEAISDLYHAAERVLQRLTERRLEPLSQDILRFNGDYISHLYTEAHRRMLYSEEFLLAVLAFRQVINEAMKVKDE